MSQTNEERKAEIETELGKLIAAFAPDEISGLANSIVMHFEESDREAVESIYRNARLVKGDPELGIAPQPELETRIRTAQMWRERRVKGIKFFKLLTEYAMIVEAPLIVAAIRAAHGTAPKQKMKKADATIKTPKPIGEG